MFHPGAPWQSEIADEVEARTGIRASELIATKGQLRTLLAIWLLMNEEGVLESRLLSENDPAIGGDAGAVRLVRFCDDPAEDGAQEVTDSLALRR